MLTSTLVVGAISLVAFWAWKRRRTFKYFEKQGIKGPEPSFFLGNMKEVQAKGIFECAENWAKEFGKTYGYYEGATPILCTSDVNLIQHVFIKDFAKFHSRKNIGLMNPYGKRVDIVMARGERWKKVRSVASPAFSAMKMKQMSPMINSVVDRLLSVLSDKAQSGLGFDMHQTFQRLTMDVIGSCAFGIDVNSLQDEKDLFLSKFNEFLKNLENKAVILKAVVFTYMLFPKLAHYISKLNLGNPLSDNFFFNLTKNIILQRKEGHVVKKNKDFIQLMLNAQANYDVSLSDLEIDLSKEDECIQDKDDTSSPKMEGLHMEEIQASSFIFLLAGFETSSTTLGLLAHHLAQSLHVQDKLHQEIDEHFPDQCIPDYGSVQKLEYLNMTIQEILRLYPIGMLGVQRHCFKASQYEDITIHPGTVVQANMASIHMDPEHWGPEDPKLFVPERFSKERKTQRHPLAWMPFGTGPRNCVGMRFALMEIKIAAARVLKHFRFLPCQETKVPLPLRKNVIRGPSEGVYIRLEERNSFKSRLCSSYQDKKIF